MKNSPPVNLLSALVCIGAFLVIFPSIFQRPPAPNSKLHGEIGRIMARDALSLLSATGKIIVIARDTATFKQPAADLLLQGFKKELRKHHATIATTQLIQLDPLRPVEAPSGDFYELIRKAPRGTVIVSFMGPPLLNEEQRNGLNTIQPEIVAFCSGNIAEQVNLRELFEHRLLHAAVVSRPLPAGLPADSTRPVVRFDELYLNITPGNLSALPPARLPADKSL